MKPKQLSCLGSQEKEKDRLKQAQSKTVLEEIFKNLSEIYIIQEKKKSLGGIPLVWKNLNKYHKHFIINIVWCNHLRGSPYKVVPTGIDLGCKIP